MGQAWLVVEPQVAHSAQTLVVERLVGASVEVLWLEELQEAHSEQTLGVEH